MQYFPKVQNIIQAHKQLIKLMYYTPLVHEADMSLKYNSNIYLKREDQTPVRSYKIRGAYNKIINVKSNNKLVCASAGNHAQGVAYSCNLLNMNCNIFMPKITTKQKIDKVIKFGKKNITIHLEGNNFDESFA